MSVYGCLCVCVCVSGAQLTKNLRTGPVSDISSTQVRNNFGPKFDLGQLYEVISSAYVRPKLIYEA